MSQSAGEKLSQLVKLVLSIDDLDGFNMTSGISLIIHWFAKNGQRRREAAEFLNRDDDGNDLMFKNWLKTFLAYR